MIDGEEGFIRRMSLVDRTERGLGLVVRVGKDGSGHDARRDKSRTERNDDRKDAG